MCVYKYVCAGSVLIQQWDAVKAVAVCDRHVTRAYERFCRAVRQQRPTALHHRKMGQPLAAASRTHLVCLSGWLQRLLLACFVGRGWVIHATWSMWCSVVYAFLYVCAHTLSLSLSLSLFYSLSLSLSNIEWQCVVVHCCHIRATPICIANLFTHVHTHSLSLSLLLSCCVTHSNSVLFYIAVSTDWTCRPMRTTPVCAASWWQQWRTHRALRGWTELLPSSPCPLPSVMAALLLSSPHSGACAEGSVCAGEMWGSVCACVCVCVCVCEREREKEEELVGGRGHFDRKSRGFWKDICGWVWVCVFMHALVCL